MVDWHVLAYMCICLYVYVSVQGLGFSVREARLGLRAAAGDLQSAVQYAVNKQKVKMDLQVESQRK